MKGLKTGGRQKGTPNKLTSEIREKLNNFVFSEIDIFIEKIDTISLEKRFDLLTKILPYTIPKLNNIELNNENNDFKNEIHNDKSIEELILIYRSMIE